MINRFQDLIERASISKWTCGHSQRTVPGLPNILSVRRPINW